MHLYACVRAHKYARDIQMGPFEDLFSCSVCYLRKYMESSWVAGTAAPGELGLTPYCAAKSPVGPAWATQAMRSSSSPSLPEWMLSPSDQKWTPSAALYTPGLSQLIAGVVLSRHGASWGLASYIHTELLQNMHIWFSEYAFLCLSC